MGEYHTFVSYAREDDSEYIRRFVADLGNAIKVRTTSDAGRINFFEARRLYAGSPDIGKRIGDRVGSTITRDRLKTVPFTDPHNSSSQPAENPEQQNASRPQGE
jgi:hypothetical protein